MSKTTPHQDRSSQHRTAVHSGTNVGAIGHVIRARKTRYGPKPEWGRIHFAQATILDIYPAGPPRNVNLSQLTREVNAKLSQNPEWRAGHGKKGNLFRQTVWRAWKLLLKY